MFQKALQPKTGLHYYHRFRQIKFAKYLDTICSFKLVLEQKPGRVLPDFASWLFRGRFSVGTAPVFFDTNVYLYIANSSINMNKDLRQLPCILRYKNESKLTIYCKCRSQHKNRLFSSTSIVLFFKSGVISLVRKTTRSHSLWAVIFNAL